MKVLVVEDDPDQLELRCLLFQMSGFSTVGACDAGSALTAAAAQKFECVVVDLRLPTERDGLALIENLKKLDPAIHVVLLTGAVPNRFSSKRQAPLIDYVSIKGGPTNDLIEHLASFAARVQSTLP